MKQFVLVLVVFFSSFSSYASEYIQVEWTDLLPEEDYQALMQMPEIDHGQDPDLVLPQEDLDESAQIDRQIEQIKRDNFNRAMQSAKVKDELKGKQVKLAGFIVPLEFSEANKLTEFFLVPYFGACMHLPPPPPNQIIHVTSKQGIHFDDIYSPYWLSGELDIKRTQHEVADSAYAMQVKEVVIYEE